jgi:phage shock protein E
MIRYAMGAVLLFSLAACSDDSDSGKSAATTVPGAAAEGYQLLSPVEGHDLIESMGAELTIIDVRTPDEFVTGHIEGAVNSDVESGQFSTYLATLDKTAPYAVYCHSGRRAAIAAQAMIDAGFTTVYDIGGIADWQAAGYPVVTG